MRWKPLQVCVNRASDGVSQKSAIISNSSFGILRKEQERAMEVFSAMEAFDSMLELWFMMVRCCMIGDVLCVV